MSPFDPALGIVFAAGGHSGRFGGGDKLLASYRGMPLFCHSLLALAPLAGCAVLVVPPGKEEVFQTALARHLLAECAGRIRVVPGGESRAESVWRGLQELERLERPPALVAVHDAARPLADARLLRRCCEAAKRSGGGAIPAHRVCDTIHQADASGRVAGTPPRESLWAAETPQVFPFALLCRAFREEEWRSSPPTDEAALLVRSGLAPVQIVEDSDDNPKITFLHELAKLP